MGRGPEVSSSGGGGWQKFGLKGVAGKSSASRESHSIEADTTRSGEMPIYSYLLTLFVLGTLFVTLDLDVKLCGHVSLGTEELGFAAVLVYTILTRK